MSRYRTLVVAVVILPLANAFSQTVDAPRYSLKAQRPEGGSLYRDTLVEGNFLPFDKTYAELTDDQRERLKSQYERLSHSDEPPFPASGLADIYRSVHAAQKRSLAEGPLSILVDIDANGTPVSAAVYKTPDKELSNFVAALLMQQKFKPSICEGRPCSMVYPFRVQLSVR